MLLDVEDVLFVKFGQAFLNEVNFLFFTVYYSLNFCLHTERFVLSQNMMTIK